MAISINAQDSDMKLKKEEIINRSWKAMFGEWQNDDIKSIYLEAVFHGKEVPNKMTVKRPNLFRNETNSGILVFNGQRAAWVERTPDEEGNPRNPEVIDSAYWRHFEVDIALIFPAFFEYPSELRGIVEINDKQTYELYVELPLGGIVMYFIDVDSFLVSRRHVIWDGEPVEDIWENLITNYIDFDGILFPDGYSFDGREGMEKGIYKNVKFNVEPSDELFEIPEGLK